MALDKNPISPSPSSARQWEERISNVFKKESEIHFDHIPSLCVFQVPKLLIHRNPQAYTPQLVGMGPYHHLMPELYHMERYKLAAIKQILDPSQILNFQHIVVDKLKQMDPLIRACYGGFMDLQEGTLAWIIAIDGLFLIHVLHTLSSYDVRGGCLSGDNILTRDIILLENQIPVVLLKEILNLVELPSPFDEEVFSMLLRFCQANSPLKISNFNDFPQPLHLLDLMYHLIVKDKGSESCVEVPIQEISVVQKGRCETKLIVNEEEDDDQDEDMLENFEEIVDFVETMGPKPTRMIIKPVKDVTNVIPWTTISGLFRTATKIDGDDEDEITIPSVASLWRYARVRCSPVLQGGICNIKFEEHEATLYLPVITLNSCSEVILRNLVAYEASMLKSTLEFARYVNLMNGIVDTAEDVRMLRQNGVIKDTSTLSDQETADLFNGMKRFFTKPDKRSNIEVAIKKVNEYYDRRMVVRLYRRMKKNADFSWKILALVSFILTLAMLAFQTFCDSYNCTRFWGPK
ncbi:PREDICTED: putative UPF0481 protein At3g02645 [Ipomoea nil]|uniref:putative UPF0481 protein At3g02645 n=1 Tax=Ipomoea nil TaxID=35883 RepID=UPI000900C93E|nr:PREDICTED: putative UPF0481 protein At3g02645 [Ipomoea nil]